MNDPGAVPIGFAHRGGSAHAPENTLAAFRLALRMGATGLETDAWVTADGVAVLDHDGVVEHGSVERPIGEVLHGDLPGHIPTAHALAGLLGPGVHLSVDVKDPSVVTPLLDALGGDDTSRLRRVWLCHPDESELVPWRAHGPDVRLVHSTRVHRLDGDVEGHAARLRRAGVQVVNMHRTDWTADLVRRYRAAGLQAWAWDAQTDDDLDDVLALGVGAVFSDRTDLLMAAIARLGPRGEGQGLSTDATAAAAASVSDDVPSVAS